MPALRVQIPQVPGCPGNPASTTDDGGSFCTSCWEQNFGPSCNGTFQCMRLGRELCHRCEGRWNVSVILCATQGCGGINVGGGFCQSCWDWWPEDRRNNPRSNNSRGRRHQQASTKRHEAGRKDGFFKTNRELVQAARDGPKTFLVVLNDLREAETPLNAVNLSTLLQKTGKLGSI